jgi:hypothetical protein
MQQVSCNIFYYLWHNNIKVNYEDISQDTSERRQTELRPRVKLKLIKHSEKSKLINGNVS